MLQVKQRPHHQRFQRGYILPLVAVLLIALMVSSLAFFNRANDATKLSGYTRDSTQAVILAESAVNLLFGKLRSNTMTVGDLNNDTLLDGAQARITVATPPLPLALPYMFYVTAAGAGIDQATPRILQMVADGESSAPGATTLQPATQAITFPAGAAQRLIRLNDLFISNAIRPRLYIQNNTGLAASNNTWATQTGDKVAVWLEVTQNPTNPLWFDLHAAAAADVGQSRGYVQRYLYTFTPTGSGPLQESANHG